MIYTRALTGHKLYVNFPPLRSGLERKNGDEKKGCGGKKTSDQHKKGGAICKYFLEALHREL